MYVHVMGVLAPNGATSGVGWREEIASEVEVVING